MLNALRCIAALAGAHSYLTYLIHMLPSFSRSAYSFLCVWWVLLCLWKGDQLHAFCFCFFFIKGVWVAVLGAEETWQLLEVNECPFVFTVNTSHYLQALLKMSLCLLLIKGASSNQHLQQSMHICRQTQTLKTHRYTPIHTQACAHRHHNPLLLSQRRVEQMLRNLRCKRELGLPPPTPHTPTHPVPHLSATPPHTHTHALTQPVLHSNTHMNLHILHQQLEDISFLSPHLLDKVCADLHAYTCIHMCKHNRIHKYTLVHALWPTSPSRLALLIRGTMWHSIPSGTMHRLCQICIVLFLLESTCPNHCPSFPLSLSLAFSLIALPLVYRTWTEMVLCLLLAPKLHQYLRWIGVLLLGNLVPMPRVPVESPTSVKLR